MKKFFYAILAFIITLAASPAQAQNITTIAGTGSIGCSGNGGPSIDATMWDMYGIATDINGNMYIDDMLCQIRKINASGIISVIAGNGTGPGYVGDGGPATLAEFYQPSGIAVDRKGNVYIADNFNNRIRKIDTFGIITTFAGTGIGGYNGDNIPATAAKISAPWDVATDSIGNVYFGGYGDGRVRKVDTAGIITTVAGSGFTSHYGDGRAAISAGISPILGLAVDGAGNIYISCGNNQSLAGGIDNCIRKVNTAGIITTIAGKTDTGYSGDGGPATAALLSYPNKIAVDKSGNLFIADNGNNRIRKVDTSDIITTYAGNGIGGFSGDGGPSVNCELNSPIAVVFNSAGNLLIVDKVNERIRIIENDGSVDTINKKDENFRLFPNPATATLTITAASQPINQIAISNLLGQAIYNHEYKAEKSVQVAIAGLPAGIYLVRINGTQAGKFVKE